MNSSELKVMMVEAFECKEEDLTEDAEINLTVGWESLSHIALMVALTNKGYNVSPSDIPELTSYIKIMDFLESKG